MNNRKFSKFASTAFLCCTLSACAQLSDGLQAVNDTLGKVNSGLGTFSGTSNTKIPMSDKVTSQYEIRNLKIELETIGEDTAAHFTGQAYNKTNRRLRISIVVPAYDPQGYHARDVRSEFTIPEKEKIRIDTTAMYALKLSKGEKLNTAKATYRVDVF